MRMHAVARRVVRICQHRVSLLAVADRSMSKIRMGVG
jgi:hypothetical protein